MKLIIFLITHWYLGLFIQSVFLHRYAAHKNFTLNKFWERFFFVINFLVFGSSYMSPNAFGILHKTHHAYADTAEDPHSPLNTPGFFKNILQTRNNYYDIFIGKNKLKYYLEGDYPQWNKFDQFAHNWMVRIAWAFVYVFIYSFLVTAWWQYLFLPITIALGALQGGIVNWCGHKFGYRNYNTPDHSRNILPIDLIFMGEAYHNNHHKHPHKLNHAVKWFEFDPTYYCLRLLDFVGIIKIKKRTL